MDIPFVELAGSARQMGQQHGEQFAQAIGRFAQIRVEECIHWVQERGVTVTTQQVLGFCQSLLDVQRRYAPNVHEEFCGIAEAAGISPALLMMGNGLTDIRDAVLQQAAATATPVRRDAGGCSAWLVASEATQTGHVLAGQTWDMHASAEEYVVAICRKPTDAPATLGITTVGCLCLAGINEAGVAIGNNNLQPSDAAEGVVYLAMITHALAQRSLAAAVNAITSAPRCSGHNYYLADADGTLVDVETTRAHVEVINPAGALYAHTNHYLSSVLRPYEAEPASESSLWRLNRLERLLYDHAGQIDPQVMMQIMADQAGHGDCNICRTNPGDEARTCAAMIMSPATLQIWAAKGPPSSNAFAPLSLDGGR